MSCRIQIWDHHCMHSAFSFLDLQFKKKKLHSNCCCKMAGPFFSLLWQNKLKIALEDLLHDNKEWAVMLLVLHHTVHTFADLLLSVTNQRKIIKFLKSSISHLIIQSAKNSYNVVDDMGDTFQSSEPIGFFKIISYNQCCW